jgi:hypothetical protein
MRHTRLALVVVIVPAAMASSLQLLQQIRLSDYVRIVDPFSDTRVAALAFSPDEEWLAVALDHDRAGHLLVLSRERSAASLRFSGRIGRTTAEQGQPGRIAWSPDGNAVAIGTTPPVLVDLERETKCELKAPDTRQTVLGSFTSSREIITGEYAGGKWRLVVYDRDCAPLQYRELPSRVLTLDGFAERGWMLVGTADGRLSIYNSGTGAIVKTWHRAVGQQAALLLHGEVVCQAGLPARERAVPECWWVVQENMIAAPPVNGGTPFSGARTAPMVAITDGKYSYD